MPAQLPTLQPPADPLQEPTADPWRVPGQSASATAAPAMPVGFATTEGPTFLKPIHHKDIAKPDVYNGQPAKWLKWSENFKRFLDRNDQPHNCWCALLDKVEELRGKPVTTADEDR